MLPYGIPLKTKITFFFSIQKLKDIKTPENASKKRKVIGGSIWLISTARNAILVLVTSLISYYAAEKGQMPFILTGKVKSGMTFKI